MQKSLRRRGRRAGDLDGVELVFDALGVDRRHELEIMRRSIAMLPPGASNALDREKAMRILADLQDVTGRLEALKRRLRELADEE